MINIQENKLLAGMTTFRIGGAARYFVEVKSEDGLREALAWAKEKGMRFALLGGGSNTLVNDEGFDGLVIHIVSDSAVFDADTVTVDAGRNLLQTIHDAAERGLGGWEKLAGIPGSVGGATRGNAGAFGSEIKDFVTSVRALNSDTLEVCEFSNDECVFSYRNSFFKQHPEWIVLATQVRLVSVDTAESERLSGETITEREKRHLQNVRAAGSFFMNPVAPAPIVEMFEKEKQVTSRENRVPAGWLIEKAGFKGARLGGAQSSTMHPNYLLNESGSATAAEVRELADTIKQAVWEQFGVELHEEAARL